VCATEEAFGNLNTVADYPAAAVLTDRSDRVNCTLKAVKRMPRTRSNQFETLIVVVAAYFTLSHGHPPSAQADHALDRRR
jgi:hypothetical protein